MTALSIQFDTGFADFFRKATSYPHYPYQERLAQAQNLPTLLVAPTGSGKTEAAVLSAWLWRRLHHPEEAVRARTPRRLVYCLPMRTLVEQTCARVRTWLDNLGLSDRVSLSVLMGGEQEDRWSLYPEKERILVGTQDMIISRALNRGYGSSPFHWPVEFGLLNNDCLWVLDEVQLMANGLPTSTQLQAFRYSLGTYGVCHTLWMSATLHARWLKTVDFAAIPNDQVFGLDPADSSNPQLAQRCHASKSLARLDALAKGAKYDPRAVAHKVSELHQAATMTIVVTNTVHRAQAIYQELEKIKPPAKLVLVHSR
ncbi:MAG: DEAD/DEAH box helicase, partial [Dehalococcoidia bacterium]|nr:DEAD/DEAH box helicase [Dehalococcoidia bacterium]